ncbi:uncharacterized protein LOC132199419 [Neocloeon triangulifer]|uniref:uncharacterized protein LOC132199419 n=1 Tax=Neocloeon triangulifer TaxID=2078957 RepID=UPI00286EF1B1|nr:uncharacterized protein LOC132199419 [Neocloeon triangulifer]
MAFSTLLAALTLANASLIEPLRQGTGPLGGRLIADVPDSEEIILKVSPHFTGEIQISIPTSSNVNQLNQEETELKRLYDALQSKINNVRGSGGGTIVININSNSYKDGLDTVRQSSTTEGYNSPVKPPQDRLVPIVTQKTTVATTTVEITTEKVASTTSAAQIIPSEVRMQIKLAESKIRLNPSGATEAGKIILSLPNHEEYAKMVISEVIDEQLERRQVPHLLIFASAAKSTQVYRHIFELMKTKGQFNKYPEDIFYIIIGVQGFIDSGNFFEPSATKQNEMLSLLIDLNVAKELVVREAVSEVSFSSRPSLKTRRFATLMAVLRSFNRFLPEIFSYYLPYVQNETSSVAKYVEYFLRGEEIYCNQIQLAYDQLINYSNQTLTPCQTLQFYLSSLIRLPILKEAIPENVYTMQCSPWFKKINAAYRRLQRQSEEVADTEFQNQLTECTRNMLLDILESNSFSPRSGQFEEITRFAIKVTVTGQYVKQGFAATSQLTGFNHCRTQNELWSYLRERNMSHLPSTGIILSQVSQFLKTAENAQEVVDDQQMCEKIIQEAPKWAQNFTLADTSSCRLINRLSGEALRVLPDVLVDDGLSAVTSVGQGSSNDDLWSIRHNDLGRAILQSGDRFLFFSLKLNQTVASAEAHSNSFQDSWYYEANPSEDGYYKFFVFARGLQYLISDAKENCAQTGLCSDSEKEQLRLWKLDCLPPCMAERK